jgi:Tfp pilus assembly protein PilF
MEQVYQSLGTEYLKAGNAEKAKASFENGLRTFPESKVLREQLDAMGD